MENTTVDEHGERTYSEPDFEPISILWWGYARGRIHEYNADDDPKANRVRRVLERGDRKIIIETVDEAVAMAFELECYIGESGCRVWLTKAMDDSIQRVHQEIIDGMADRGYTHVTRNYNRTDDFVPAEPAPDFDYPDPEDVDPGLSELPSPSDVGWDAYYDHLDRIIESIPPAADGNVYAPPLTEHPDYDPDFDPVSEIDVGDVVTLLGYRRGTTHEYGAGPHTNVSDPTTIYAEPSGVSNYTVNAIYPDAGTADVTFVSSTDTVALERIAGVNTDRTESRRLARHRRACREQADMDALLELCKEHARQVCAEVWPGGTVDPDDIYWFWNTRLSNSAGYCYRDCIPDYSGAPSRWGVGIALSPGYYYSHGLAELLAVVRHELIHAWEALHPDAGRIGHGPQFKQWVDDMDTHRHCKQWSK